MKFFRFFLIIFFILLFKYALADYGSLSFPNFPMAFYGRVFINNNPAPAGSILRAYSNQNVVGEVVLKEDGVYGYKDSTKQKLLIGGNIDSSSTIFFSIQHPSINNNEEIKSDFSEQFVSGTTTLKDFFFKFDETTSTTQTSTVSHSGGSGGSSGGGSGGGSGGYSGGSFRVKKGDINKDNKVDKYDFALMMANWGKKGVNDCDLNNDGVVDKYDFSLLMLNWGL